MNCNFFFKYRTRLIASFFICRLFIQILVVILHIYFLKEDMLQDGQGFKKTEKKHVVLKTTLEIKVCFLEIP